MPNPSTGFAYSSSAFRDSVEKPNEKNKELFLDYMPEGSDIDTIWDILTNDIARKDENLNGDLDSFISKTLDEISTMGGGSVEGSSGSGFGPPNTYNVYTRNPRVKSKKPKVRRPKRSRREKMEFSETNTKRKTHGKKVNQRKCPPEIKKQIKS